MAIGYVLYNPLAGDGSCKLSAQALGILLPDELVFSDMTKTDFYEQTLFDLQPEDYIVLCGGDGTLNRFINITEGVDIRNKIYYLPAGTGNDFAKDLGKTPQEIPFEINNYIKDLPQVNVHGRTIRFLNGVGYGLDGYCCQVGDEMRAKGKKKVNYTAIAIKGLLFHYKPTNARVTVDGVRYNFKKVWLAPTMHGRYYGRGMIPTPNQDRNAPEQTLSCMIMHGTGKLRTLMIFPSIFKGEHIRHQKAVKILTGKEIRVQFDRPVALQIDGETLLRVTEYTATAG